MIHVRLGEALELAYGKSLPKKSRRGGSIPVYGSNGITDWNDTALVNDPTVIVGRKGSAGAIHFVEQPCFPIDTTYFVRPRDGFDFDMKFVFYLLRSANLPRLATATGVPGLTRDDAYNENISVPSLEEQRRIADLLSRAEGILHLRREAQRKAAELAPALFLDMFGDPASNPRGWPMVRIDSLSSVQTGATPRREEARYFDGGTVPWIKTTSVVGGLIVAAEDFITESAVAGTNCKVFPAATILVAMYGQGQTRGRVGILAIPAATNQACAAILPSGKIEQPFLFHTLRIQYERLRAMGRGGNQANLNLSMIKELEVPLPPLELQRAFAAKVDAVRGIAAQQDAALATAQATFDALLHQSFQH